MTNIIIVDDEPLALEVLETYIERLPEVNLVRSCSNAIEANEVLKNNNIQLMFLDIQMPQLTGIDFLKSLSQPPLVIFTTAYSNYAVEGFELNAVDYLLKPISFERFLKALNKAAEQIKKREQPNIHTDNDTVDHIFVKSDKRLVRVKFDEMVYIEGLKDYVIIKTETGRIITLQTMKSLEEKLPQHLFKRVHRSFIVNIDKIVAVDGNMLEVNEKGKPKQIPIGKNYRDELLEFIEKNKL
ncbi:MAG: response regulator transcription factor [Saprospiraceae bacterium]|nr:response regulator transcription factor [Saprospiraceae bacterium]MBP7699264.1 response regulator transcription factor [Saprospiraceae bacterium]